MSITFATAGRNGPQEDSSPPDALLPKELIPDVMNVLRPAKVADRRYKLRKVKDLGWLATLYIKTSSGEEHSLTIYDNGVNPLLFIFDGVICQRSGDYLPTSPPLSKFELFEPEGQIFAAILQDVIDGEYNTNSQYRMDKLLRSAGKTKPPNNAGT